MKEQILGKVTGIAERVCASEGLELVEIHLAGGGGRRVLKIVIDKPGGVTHGDCETVSQQVGTILDVEDAIPGAGYTLEVSSPGVERKLLKPIDYERFSGQKAKIVLRQPIQSSRHFVGTLAGFADGMIRLETAPGETLAIPFEQVEKANLKFEW